MMGRKIQKSNIRIEVYPCPPGDFGFVTMSGITQSEEETIAQCEAIAGQIRRHIDDLPSGRNRGVRIVWDAADFCEHCGWDWTEGDSPHNGGCCAKDEEVMNALDATQ